MNKHDRYVEKGFTLIEMMLAAGLTVSVLVVAMYWFGTAHKSLQNNMSDHKLHGEAETAMDLMTRLLSGADPLSIEISSSPESPWSRLAFKTKKHRYAFAQSSRQLLFYKDSQSPQVLVDNVVAIHFAVERNQLPTLLHWRMRLMPRRKGREISFSGTRYLENPPE